MPNERNLGPTFLLMGLVAMSCDGGRDRPPSGTPTRYDSGVARDAGEVVIRDGGPGSVRDGGPGSVRDGGPGSVRDGGPGAVRDGGGVADAGTVDASIPGTPYCRQTCASANDCSQGSPAFDVDNYRCAANRCEYTGCNSDAECAATYQLPYVCRRIGGNTTASCYAPCTTANDCASPAPLFGPDNYRCSSGACEWRGCQSTAECTETYANPAYVCAPQAGLPYDNCILGCSTPSECVTAGALPAYDIDNYTCNGSNLCEYTGCLSTTECSGTFTTGTWTCE